MDERTNGLDATLGPRYDRDFFARAPDDVAHDLIGSLMTVRDDDGLVVVRVLEAEAYGGSDDAASHASGGPTPRCRVMFGPAGHLYVYRIYGVHWCVNVVTGDEGAASAVLLRAATLVHREASNRDRTPPGSLRGPGNLTRALSITGADNGRDCCSSTERVAFHASNHPHRTPVSVSPRVGVTRNAQRPSRYFATGHPEVSRFNPARPRANRIAQSTPSG